MKCGAVTNKVVDDNLDGAFASEVSGGVVLDEDEADGGIKGGLVSSGLLQRR